MFVLYMDKPIATKGWRMSHRYLEECFYTMFYFHILRKGDWGKEELGVAHCKQIQMHQMH